MSGEERARNEQHSSADELESQLDLDERAQLLVDTLSEDEAAHLVTTVGAARTEYARALNTFAEGVVGSLPRPLRGRAARILAKG